MRSSQTIAVLGVGSSDPFLFWVAKFAHHERPVCLFGEKLWGDNYMRSLARISLSLVQLVRAGVPAARSHRPAVNLVNLGPYPRGVNTSRGHPETNGLAPGAGKILFRLVESSSVTSTLINPSNHDCPASHPVPSHPIQSHPPYPHNMIRLPPVRYGLTLDAQRHALILPAGGPVPKGGSTYTHMQ